MTGTILTLCLIGGGVLFLVLTVWGILSRYRRSAPDELLVVFGKSGKIQVTGEDGKKETLIVPSKIIQGGGYICMANHSRLEENVNEAYSD